MREVVRIQLSLVVLAIVVGQPARCEGVAAATTQATISLSPAYGPLDKLELLVPFYEGILIRNPVTALPEVNLPSFQLTYPGTLSAPFIPWRFGEGGWSVLYADSLSALPVALDLGATLKEVRFRLTSHVPCTFKSLEVQGSWEVMARILRTRWNLANPRRRLSDDFDRISFYVHQFVADRDEPLRTDWTADRLAPEMLCVNPRTLVHVYGLDPSGVDLGGKYLWSKNAETTTRKVIDANPNVANFAWLNLRTFKTAIPRLNLSASVDQEVRKMAKVYPNGIRHRESYCFKSLEMCPASEDWQASRLRQFDRLVSFGFRVIQLDEFPIPGVWHLEPCLSQEHLHRPGNAADEWSKSLQLVARLSECAEAKGVLITCEEPCAALLPHVSGYIDRQFNANYDLIYAPWTKSRSIQAVQLFSTMFGNLVTPFTNVDDLELARTPPGAWLQVHKVKSRH
jgi:hypothetical protein